MEIEKLIQEDFDDGIQTLIVCFTEGRQVEQKWEWPESKFRDGGSNSAHEIFDVMFGDKLDPNVIYHCITKIAKQVSGPVIKMEQIDGTD